MVHSCHDNGNKYYEAWFKEDTTIYHKIDGPALQYWYSDGIINSQFYFIDGKHHRLDGPSYISYDESGVTISKEYWINGEEIDCSSDEEFKKIVKLLSFK